MGDIVEIEPLTDAEAEAGFIALVTLFDQRGCAPAAVITDKTDEGVSIALHFSATRLRELLAAKGEVTDAMLDAGVRAWMEAGGTLCDSADLVGPIYLAMQAASLDTAQHGDPV